MLILSEENKKLKGTIHKLPDDIYAIFKNIVLNHLPSNETSYKKAKNVIKDHGYITMEWLKNMKHYFSKHQNESDPEFLKMGGYPVKYYVESKLDKLTTSYGRAEHTNSATKPRKNSSNLGGNRGEKSSQSLSIVNSIMSDIIPRFESKENKKILIVTEEQLKQIRMYL
jgi:hypothetical protein